MGKKFMYMLVILACLTCASCRKTCRCIGYDGSVDEFSMEEIDEQNITCEDKELEQLGRRYTYCKRVF